MLSRTSPTKATSARLMSDRGPTSPPIAARQLTVSDRQLIHRVCRRQLELLVIEAGGLVEMTQDGVEEVGPDRMAAGLLQAWPSDKAGAIRKPLQGGLRRPAAEKWIAARRSCASRRPSKDP